MLIEFRVKNFRSFRDEAVLSLVASNDTEHPQNVAEVGKLRLLRSAAIYGPNASGKSNLLKAISFFQDFVKSSADTEPGKEIAVQPFRLDPRSAKAPSEFEATFIHEEVRYRYGFVVSRQRVEEEWLSAYPHGREQMWFKRTAELTGKGSNWEFGSNLKGQKSQWAELTKPNSLFLSVAAKFNSEQLALPYSWLSGQLTRPWAPWQARDLFASGMVEAPPIVRKWLLSFLSGFDLGFCDVDVKKIDADQYLQEALERDPFTVSFAEVHAANEGKLKPFEITTIHQGADKASVRFQLKDESEGSQRVIDLAGHWVAAFMMPICLIVDEIESSLHPLLSRKLVEMFHDHKWNKKNAQLVFATHDTNLMDLKLLRRDQIWFTERDSDGASHLYSLHDFRVRKGEAIEKGYLAGRYGALPILEDMGD